MLLNKRRAQEFMGKYDLKAIIATSAVNVSYFTGFDCWMYRGFRENMLTPGAPNSLVQSYAVLTPDREPVLITATYNAPFPVERGVEVRSYGQAASSLPPKKQGESPVLAMLRRVVQTEGASPAEALVKLLQDMGLSGGRVGVESRNLSESTRTTLEKQLPMVDFQDCTELIRFIRMVKTDEEIARLRKAAEISEKGLKKSLPKARAGAKAGDVRQAFLTEVSRNGALFEHWAFSPAGFGQSDDPSYRFRRGDYASIDVGSIYKLYYSDTGTTFVVGRDADGVSKLYQTMWEIFDVVLDVLRPGSTPSSILRTFERSYRSQGIKDVDYQGHGIGLETREHPVIAHSKYESVSDRIVNQKIDIPLEEGMTINIETPLNRPGRGGYQLERTFLVGRSSAREITPKRKDSPFLTR